MIEKVVALLIGAYFIGGIPFAVLIARANGVEIFNVGSGNPGATNVNRALGAKWGVVVFLLDVLKGAGPALVARFVLPDPKDQIYWACVGLAAVIGHVYSPYLKFKGGKGVSSILGAVLAASPAVALCAFGVFILTVLITRFVSLGSILAVISALFWARVWGDQPAMYAFYGVLSVLVLYKHRANLMRLRAGTESRFSFGKKPSVS